jgi:hypothetical protein
MRSLRTRRDVARAEYQLQNPHVEYLDQPFASGAEFDLSVLSLQFSFALAHWALAELA